MVADKSGYAVARRDALDQGVDVALAMDDVRTMAFNDLVELAHRGAAREAQILEVGSERNAVLGIGPVFAAETDPNAAVAELTQNAACAVHEAFTATHWIADARNDHIYRNKVGQVGKAVAK